MIRYKIRCHVLPFLHKIIDNQDYFASAFDTLHETLDLHKFFRGKYGAKKKGAKEEEIKDKDVIPICKGRILIYTGL